MFLNGSETPINIGRGERRERIKAGANQIKYLDKEGQANLPSKMN